MVIPICDRWPGGYQAQAWLNNSWYRARLARAFLCPAIAPRRQPGGRLAPYLDLIALATDYVSGCDAYVELCAYVIESMVKTSLYEAHTIIEVGVATRSELPAIGVRY